MLAQTAVPLSVQMLRQRTNVSASSSITTPIGAILKSVSYVFTLLFKVKFIILLIAFSVISVSSVAQQFNYHETCKSTYNKIMELKIPLALQIIEQQKQAEPDNYAWLLLESYCGFLTIYIQEDYKVFKQFEDDFDYRISKINQLSDNNPWKRYVKAELNLHKAFARAKFEEYIATLWELRKGFKLLEENARKFPDFQPNQKSLGFFHSIIGTIPNKYRFGAKLLGFSGSVEQGMQELKNYQSFAKAENTFYEEVHLIHIFFLIYLDKKHQEAWQIVQQELQPEQNLLHNFLYAEVAYKAGEGDIAINAIENRPSGDEYLPYHFMNFFTGILKMTRLDEDAGTHIEQFLNNFTGKHYVKEAWQRLALCNLMKGDTALYFKQLANCKKQGATLMDADRQAMKDAELKTLPNVDLLKARFLNDGGYTSRALTILNQMDTAQLSIDHKIEWLYRYAKVYQMAGDNDKAHFFYNATINTSPNNELYFGAKSCLQLGHMCVSNNQFALAEEYYKRVGKFDKHPFKNSFEQQAKAEPFTNLKI